jgi:DHA2 family multidrug resistance protein
MVLGALMGTVLFILPQYLRNVQSFSASQTGVLFGLYASGLFVGGMLAIRVLLPRFGGFFTLVFGFSVLLVSLLVSVDLFTPDTPTPTLIAIVAVQGFAVAPMWFGVSNVTVGQIALPRLSEADATYYFVRQLGNSFGVTFASVVFDRRLTFHSSRLLDTANRLDPTTARYLKAFAATVARNAGGGNQPALGSLQIFQQLIGVQSRLLAFVDISYCLGILCAVGILLAVLMRANVRKALHQIHVW